VGVPYGPRRLREVEQMFKKATIIAFLIGWGFAMLISPQGVVNFVRGKK
jgi:hypothetical protein